MTSPSTGVPLKPLSDKQALKMLLDFGGWERRSFQDLFNLDVHLATDSRAYLDLSADLSDSYGHTVWSPGLLAYFPAHLLRLALDTYLTFKSTRL